jgi:uncharacterized protein YaeQ
LSFGRGLSAEQEPALWQKDLTGIIDLWIEVGQPEEKSIRQACGRAKQVCIYTYGGRTADQWWEKNFTTFERLSNLSVMNLPLNGSRALTTFAKAGMELQCTIQEGNVWIADGENTAHIELTILKAPSIQERQ